MTEKVCLCLRPAVPHLCARYINFTTDRRCSVRGSQLGATRQILLELYSNPHEHLLGCMCRCTLRAPSSRNKNPEDAKIAVLLIRLVIRLLPMHLNNMIQCCLSIILSTTVERQREQGKIQTKKEKKKKALSSESAGVWMGGIIGVPLGAPLDMAGQTIEVTHVGIPSVIIHTAAARRVDKTADKH